MDEKLVFVQSSLGNYHYPRMQALAEECHKVNIHLTNIELAGNQKENRWVVDNKLAKFNNITLFPDKNLENIPTNYLWRSLKHTLEIIRPDVIFIIGYSEEIMRRVKFWADRRKVASVIVSDSNEFDKKRYGIIEFVKSMFVRRFDAAFVGGTSSRQYVQKLGIPAERICEGCDVIDTALFSTQACKNRKVYLQVREKWKLPENFFLFVGRLIKEKNLPKLLDSYAKYLAKIDGNLTPWKLVICGSGSEEEKLVNLINRFPEDFQKKILFYGYIKQPEIIDFYSSASCLILPSISETWGLVVNEALACSIPVIVSQKAGCGLDLVKQNINGWKFDPNNSYELTDLMLSVTKMDSATRAQMGLEGHNLISEWVLDRFSKSALRCAQIAKDHRKHNRS